MTVGGVGVGDVETTGLTGASTDVVVAPVGARTLVLDGAVAEFASDAGGTTVCDTAAEAAVGAEPAPNAPAFTEPGFVAELGLVPEAEFAAEPE